MEILKTFPLSSWQESFSSTAQMDMTQSLEQGHVLFFPQLEFQLFESEHSVLSPEYVSPKSKNISFNKLTGELRGIVSDIPLEKEKILEELLVRFADQAQNFIIKLFPHYQSFLKIGRTSFRPVEVKGRPSSYRKDDSRLHVDAFPANPNHGWRLLRLFCNINPHGKARVWRLGEPFEKVAQQFLPRLKKPIPGTAKLLHLLKITKRYRTLYDHYMLQLHDKMKADEVYQRNALQQKIDFPARSTWVVQTDHVSHAALSGQHLLEQTFYLPVHAMLDEVHSPLRVLERFLNQVLI